jgi:hypothetical protein
MNVLRDLKYGLRTLTKRPVFSLSRMTVALLSVIGGLSFAQVLAAGEVLEDVVERRFPLDPSGTFSLRAIDGTVEIFGTDSREVKIVATKKAFSMERLNAIAIRVDARADAVNIETTPPPAPSHRFSDRSGTVEYTINVPQTAANLGSGQLVTHNCFCDQNIHVNKGVLNVFFDWLEEERPISIEAGIEDGNMAARFPTDATFHLHAVSKEGHVSSDFSPMETRKRGDDSEINEVIGDAPTTKLNFRASEGNIHISEVIW